MRGEATQAEMIKALTKPKYATRRAGAGPKRRFSTSATRKAIGEVTARQVNQLLIGNCTRKFEDTTMTIITATESTACCGVIKSKAEQWLFEFITAKVIWS